MSEPLSIRARRELGLAVASHQQRPMAAVYGGRSSSLLPLNLGVDPGWATVAGADVPATQDEIARTLRRMGSRWRPAMQALHDAATGRATLLDVRTLDRMRPYRDAADALTGHLLVEGAARGSRHVPRAPRTTGNAVELLVRNEQVLPRLYDDLAAAKRSIFISQFNWEPDGGGARVLELLERKAREGVDVRVVVDAWGFRERGWDTARAMQDRLEAAGAKVQRSWGMVPGGTWEHRKLVAIDDLVAYAGGLGFGAKYDTWTDVMLRMEGPAAAVAGAHGITTWRDLAGPLDVDAERMLHFVNARLSASFAPVGALEQGRRAAVTLLENRPGIDLAATESFLRDAATAKRRLWATSTYATSPDAIRALADAARRGVDVKLVVSGPGVGFDEPFIRLGRTHYRELLDAGVEVFERTTMTHAKGWLADDVVNVGSMNLSHSSMARAREVMARVEDAGLVRDYAAFHTELRGAARQVTADLLRERGVRVLTAIRKLVPFRV